MLGYGNIQVFQNYNPENLPMDAFVARADFTYSDGSIAQATGYSLRDAIEQLSRILDRRGWPGLSNPCR